MALGFTSGSVVKNPPVMQETRAWSLGQEDLLEEGMATHPSIPAWKTPWTEEPGRLLPMGPQKSLTWLKWWNTSNIHSTGTFLNNTDSIQSCIKEYYGTGFFSHKDLKLCLLLLISTFIGCNTYNESDTYLEKHYSRMFKSKFSALMTSNSGSTAYWQHLILSTSYLT